MHPFQQIHVSADYMVYLSHANDLIQSVSVTLQVNLYIKNYAFNQMGGDMMKFDLEVREVHQCI